MSIQSLYATARRSLLANQAATNATGQNIANANTPGYTRRQVQLRSIPPTRGGVFFHGIPNAGGGAGVESFNRVRSQILDVAVRKGQAGSGGAGESAALLATLESQLAPDGGDGFLEAVSSFFDAWGDVADAPTDLGVRDALLSAADRLAHTLQGADERLRAFGRSVETDLSATVDHTNQLLREVADLNGSIRTSNSQGALDPDALDRRDAIIDELSALGPFTARYEDNGTVTLTIDGMVAVQDLEARPLRVTLPPETDVASVYADGGSRPLRFGGSNDGAIGAQVYLLGSTLPDALASLNALAAEIVNGVNGVHIGGTGLDGGTNRDFFDPAGTLAATISVSSSLTSDGIAAGTGAPGDASLATSIFGLGNATHESATRLLSGIGAKVRASTAEAQANAAYTDHAMALRDGVSKVSLDEEMANLIQYQQAYAASARVLETAESLFDTLLTL
ncbi:MAG: flagellar hook-associated protein FlgK [Bacteroidota bacterium]